MPTFGRQPDSVDNGSADRPHDDRPMPSEQQGGHPADTLWGVQEVAAFLKVPIATVYRWRHLRAGPPGRRVGRHIRYDPDDVRTWFRQLGHG